MRIRTIKPEFYQSESIGRLSRDARSLFVGLFSLSDDLGRFRANPRLVTASLFPYDVDALALMPGWMAELEREGCIVLYVAGGNSYGAIPKWTDHQKIDKPSPSKLPPAPNSPTPREPSESPREDSTTPRESSWEEGKGEDQGSGIKGEEAKGAPPPENLRGELEHEYRAANQGAVYAWGKRDDSALKTLVGMARESDEVVARWGAALRSRKKFPKIHTLAELAQHWNHFPVAKPHDVEASP